MTPQDKANQIGPILDQLYPSLPIPLIHDSPYTLLIGVLLSAQSTDKQVNKVTPLLFARANQPQTMVELTVEEIEAIIKPVGLGPRKAQAIHALSQQLLEKHGGEVPRNFTDLEALPGVGHKTASVVMNQAFGLPAFAVDTHIHRLAERWGLSDGKNVVQTERDLKQLFPESLWGKRHLQMIYFGREHCPARGHDFSQCPICSWARE